MKKILSIGLLAVSLLLTGCAQDTAEVSDGNNVIIKNGNSSFTKQDLFEEMKGNDYTTIIVGNLVRQIALKEGISQEEIDKEIDTQIAQFKTVYGENYQKAVEAQGGEEAFRKSLTSGVSKTLLFKKYTTNNLEKFIGEYSPIKAQIAYFSTGDAAQEFINEVKAGADFAATATAKGYPLSAAAKIYTDKDSDVVVEIKSYFNDTAKNGLSEPLVTMTTTTDNTGAKVETARYYVVNIIDRDSKNFTDEFIALMQTKINPTEILSHYFNEHEVRFHDQRTYDLLAQVFTGIR